MAKIKTKDKPDAIGVNLFRKYRRLSGVLLAFVLLTVFFGCRPVGSNYIRKPVNVPVAWRTDIVNGLSENAANCQSQVDWWSIFNDMVLSDLMNRVVNGNLDLKEAKSRLYEARAQRGISKAESFPAIDAMGSASKTRSSSKTGEGETRAFFSAGFDSSWELDIFGGILRSVEAAEANIEAAYGDAGDVTVSLLAEIARNYVELRTFQAELAVTEANILAQDETRRLAAWRLSSGLGNELELEQARYNLASTLSAKPILKVNIEEAKNRLAVLLGLPPGSIHKTLEAIGPIPTPREKIAVGVPADTLRQRPDVYRAERELAAQTAMIGVATAKLYPQFTLNGSIGVEALSAKSLFSLSGRTSSIGPQVIWSIFNGGAVRRNIEVQSALRDQALYQYESAILRALEEVENALLSYDGEQHRASSLFEAVRAAGQAEALARVRYESGLDDFGTVLEAQRSLYSFQSQLAESRGMAASDFIALYKALGGGWRPLDSNSEENNSDLMGIHRNEDEPSGKN